MHSNGFGRRTNVGNMVGIAEKIDGGLAVKEKKIFVDGSTGGRRASASWARIITLSSSLATEASSAFIA